jgi:hypothetical protein
MNVGRVRQILSTAVASAAVASAWAAPAALAANPSVPKATDFEQRLGEVARVTPERAKRSAGEGPVTHVSAAIEAPHRFDLAGLAKERRALELRARDAGGQWSEWVETSNGDPVYFGGADQLQLRTRGWRPRGAIHYVDVSEPTTAPSVSAPRAKALPVRPPIITRAAWGANRPEGGCLPRETPTRGLVKGAVIHHTVTSGKYTAAQAPSIVLGICRYHRNGNGWNDIGYNALVDRFGNLYMGRAGGLQRAVIGAHAQGFNGQTTGIAAIGTHVATPMTTVTIDSIVNFLAWKLSKHGVPAQGKAMMTSAGGSASRYEDGERVRLQRIVGHRQVGLTTCPGASAFTQLPLIRRLTQERIDAGGYIPPPPPTEPLPSPTDPSGGTIPK